MMKRIYTWESGGAIFRRVFVIGNYAKDLGSAMALCEKITKDFPAIDHRSVEIGIVTRSDRIKGYQVATALLPDDATIPRGWDHCGESPDFRWD